MCQKNPYVTTTTPITEMPDIDVIEPTGPSFLPDINESIDGVILSEEIQGKYENSSCWNNIEKYAGFSACWSSVYYNTKLTIPSYTESQAKQVCMKLCNENQ